MKEDFIIKSVLTDRTVFFRELKVKHYKTILKSIIGDEIDYETAFNNISNIICCISDFTDAEITDLNFLDYFILLFEIRSSSISSLIIAETTDDSTTKIEINIQRFIDRLKEVNVKQLLQPEVLDGFTLQYKLPTVNEIINLNTDNLKDIYSLFIKGLSHKSVHINFQNLNKQELLQALERLPAKLTTRIINRSQSIIETFNNINLISYLPGLKDKQLVFNFNKNNLGLIVKLLFGDELFSLYHNMFTLAKTSNITPEYIENCTPGEYFLYVKKLETLTKSTQSNTDNIMTDDPEGMFDDLPPITSRSEFTPQG